MTCASVSNCVSGAFRGAGQLICTAANAVYEGARKVEGYWEEANSHVADWTEKFLPMPLAKIAQAFIQALPFFLLSLFTPLPVSLGVGLLFIGFGVIQNMRGDVPSPERGHMFTNGVGFAQIVKGVMGIGLGIILKTPLPAVLGALQLIGAVACFARSGLIKDVCSG